MSRTALTVKSPKPSPRPAYTIESAAGEELARVPITASGNSYQLALAMAAGPALLEFANLVIHYADNIRREKPGITDGQWAMFVKEARALKAGAEQ